MSKTKVYVVVDLGFGDAGKGSVVDYLVRTRNAGTVVRFNGGAQASHNVVLPDGRRHAFSQFGSGTFVPGVKTYLTSDVLFDPVSLLGEEQALQQVGVTDAFSRFAVHGDCLVVTPFHKAANRLRELKRDKRRHGSCGMGIGEAVSDATGGDNICVRVKDLLLPADTLRFKLEWVRMYNEGKCLVFDKNYKQHAEYENLRPEAVDWFMEICREVVASVKVVDDKYEQEHVFNCDSDQVVVCEGAQGILLDEKFGFHPHTTWSTVTPHKILDKIREANYLTNVGSLGEVERVGVTRAYMTRHGEGPFPTWEPGCSKTWEALGATDANKENKWQGNFRVGWLDTVLLRYAVEACKVPWTTASIDWLAVTCMDRLGSACCNGVPVCTHYVSHRTTESIVRDLPVARNPTLVTQELLTRLLSDTSNGLPAINPYFKVVPLGDLQKRIAAEVGVPVGLTSHGETFQDKLEWPADIDHEVFGKTEVKRHHGEEKKPSRDDRDARADERELP